MLSSQRKLGLSLFRVSKNFILFLTSTAGSTVWISFCITGSDTSHWAGSSCELAADEDDDDDDEDVTDGNRWKSIAIILLSEQLKNKKDYGTCGCYWFKRRCLSSNIKFSGIRLLKVIQTTSSELIVYYIGNFDFLKFAHLSFFLNFIGNWSRFSNNIGFMILIIHFFISQFIDKLFGYLWR